MFQDFSEIVQLSLRVTGTALLISTLLGVPAGALIGLNRFRGRRLVAVLFYTGMGFPPVVIGLFVYLMLLILVHLAMNTKYKIMVKVVHGKWTQWFTV